MASHLALASSDLPLGNLLSDGVRVAVDGDPLPGADAAHGPECGDHVEERRGTEGRGGHRLDGAVAIGAGRPATATNLDLVVKSVRKIKAKSTCVVLTPEKNYR